MAEAEARPRDEARPDAANAPGADAPSPSKRRRALLVVGAIAAVVVGGVLVHHLLTRGEEGTDDAEVDADVVPLAARVAGHVAAAPVVENQAVRRGELVLQLDDRDYAARVAQAAAELDGARAQVEQARANLASREADLRLAEVDLRRAETLRRSSAIPQQQLDRARSQHEAAQAAVAAARSSGTVQVARVKGAEAALALARLDLEETRVVAPEDGVVSGISSHAGAYLAVGQTVAQLVPARKYVTANFKETQVGRMRPGQPADVAVDTYGRTLRGRVESLSGGTGARFSLLPPENATGNFVKVAQRIPVRIALDGVPDGVTLRAGQSVVVTVHVR